MAAGLVWHGTSSEIMELPIKPKLIPKGNYGISIWVQDLLDKYSSYRPTQRLLGQLEQDNLDLLVTEMRSSSGSNLDKVVYFP